MKRKTRKKRRRKRRERQKRNSPRLLLWEKRRMSMLLLHLRIDKRQKKRIERFLFAFLFGIVEEKHKHSHHCRAYDFGYRQTLGRMALN